jgi:dTDP-4-amino-4,6-dideoxygalactose transaminase
MFKVGKEEVDAMAEAVLSQKYFRYQGENVPTITSQCEEDWCDFLRAKYCLLTTSGTNALVVGMAAFGIGPGDEVIIPSYTFVATASAIMQVGAIPIIANIDNTLTLDPQEVIKKITPRTKAVVAVHMDGLICDLQGLLSICKTHNLLLIEDAAQACGGEYRGQPVGTVGSFGGFSFNVDKVISCGEGGLLVIKDEANEKEYLKSLVTHDTACQFGRTLKNQVSTLPRFFGLSTRLNEINSSMLRVQLQRLPEIIKDLRMLKMELRQYCESLGLSVMKGHDDEGDIGTVLHLRCQDPIDTMEKSKILLADGFKAGPPYLRPAHACWQWFEAMQRGAYFVEGLNPYNLTDQTYSYTKQEFLPTLEILGGCLRLELNFLGDEERIQSCKDLLKKIAEK